MPANKREFLPLSFRMVSGHLWGKAICLMEQKSCKRHRLSWVALVIFIGITGMYPVCTPDPSQCSALGTGGGRFPINMFTYGNGMQIDAVLYNSIQLRKDDNIYLKFPCAVQLQAPPSGATVNMQDGGLTAFIIYTGISGTTINFTRPDGSNPYTFSIEHGDVWPGDANADGRRNISDLARIAHGIRHEAHGIASGAGLHYPPNPAQMNTFYSVSDWGASSLLGGKLVNFKHADCNLDGKVDWEDVEYLSAVLGPLLPNEYLVDGVNGLKLEAAYLPSPTLTIALMSDGTPTLKLPFEISVSSGTTIPDSFLGVSFTRPIAESPDYNVHHTEFVFPAPNLILDDPSHLNFVLWRQYFWDQTGVTHENSSCAPIVDKPLDVGVFNTKLDLNVPASSARIGHCNVFLEDVLMHGLSAFNLTQHLVNGVVYSIQDGQLLANSIECSSDVTQISVEGLCNVSGGPFVVRDGLQDDGSQDMVSEENTWLSPDIWIKQGNNKIGHDNPVMGKTSQVMVRVHNMSCHKDTSGSVVKVYWMRTGTSLMWNGFPNANAGFVGSVPISPIPAWGSKTVSMNWAVPHLNVPAGQEAAFTLVAIVGHPTTSLSTGSVHDQVRSSKLAAGYSLFKLGKGSALPTPTATLWINPDPSMTSPIKLFIEQMSGSPSRPASRYGKIEIVNPNSSGPSLAPLMNMSPSGPSSYALNSDRTSGALQLDFSNTTPFPLGIRFQQTSPNPGGELTYRYRVHAVSGPNHHNGQVFEFTVSAN